MTLSLKDREKTVIKGNGREGKTKIYIQKYKTIQLKTLVLGPGFSKAEKFHPNSVFLFLEVLCN